MRRIVFSALTVCGLALLGSDLRADDSSPFQLLGSSQVSSNQSVEVTPVRWGYGWRGPGYLQFGLLTGGQRPTAAFRGCRKLSDDRAPVPLPARPGS